MWIPPHIRLGYYCHHPRTSPLTYTTLDHCRPLYLFDSVQFFSRNKRIVMYFYSLAFIALFTYSPLSPLPSSSSSCYSRSFLSLMHDPFSSLVYSFSPCCHICYISVNILQAGSIPVLSAATSSSPAFPLLLPKSCSNISKSSYPSAVQVPQKSLVLKRGGRFFPSLGSK